MMKSPAVNLMELIGGGILHRISGFHQQKDANIFFNW